MKAFQVCIMAFLLSACTKTEYVDVDVNPKLEIKVTYESSAPVTGATVKLYATEDGFLDDAGVLEILTTGSDGKVLFENLSESVYYFRASKEGKDNYYEVVSFDMPLEMNEIRVVQTIIR